ncbi:MAG TPA: NAD(P)/FAD-dependent oxidoreductase [Vicinamibacterales bacterium]|nr:NAD(P)/FAD-dependent oxidoreductase [Vicinamibacterales bacterium]
MTAAEGPQKAQMTQTPSRYDAIVIGGGVNGLTCAAYLGKRGVRTLLVEQREQLGGCAAEGEIAPGFTVPTLAHSTGPLRNDVVEELQLYRHGLHFSEVPITVSALSPDGRALVLWQDARRTAESLRASSAKDAAAWPGFHDSLHRLGALIAGLLIATPPSVDSPSTRDVFALMQTLSAFRKLPKADQWRLLRWGPMAVADLVSEAVEDELLRATIAADGVFGAMLGPWSAGSGLQLLLMHANRAMAWPSGNVVAHGPIAVSRALERAAQGYGVAIKTGDGAHRINVKDDRAVGVTLASGESVDARAVVSAVDPKRTFLRLCDAEHLPPEFLWRIKHYRSRGTLAKINLALSALPDFAGATRDMLAGRVRLAPDLDYLERAFDHAKYGRFSPHPWIEFTVPSIANDALAPRGAHVLSAYAQFAPYTLRDGDWDGSRDAFGQCVIDTLEHHAPGITSRIVAREVLTPLDFERGWGLSGGQIFHGELSLDQFFTMRPLLGYGQYSTPLRGLYLCSNGTHPGTGLTGGSGINAAREIARSLS